MDTLDINRQLRAFYAKCNYLIRNHSLCSPEVKCKLFSAFCSNMYCGHIWSFYKKASISKITVAYNNSFRRLMGLIKSCSASGMFVNNKVLSFGEMWRKCINGFKNRLSNSTNNVISCILDCAIYNSSSVWRNWYTILY